MLHTLNPANACRQFRTEQVGICSLVGQPPDCRKSLVDSACIKSKRLEVQATLRTAIRFRGRLGSKKHQLMNCSIAKSTCVTRRVFRRVIGCRHTKAPDWRNMACCRNSLLTSPPNCPHVGRRLSSGCVTARRVNSLTVLVEGLTWWIESTVVAPCGGPPLDRTPGVSS